MSQIASDPLLDQIRAIRASARGSDPMLDQIRAIRASRATATNEPNPVYNPHDDFYGQVNPVGVPGTVSTPGGVIPMPPSRTDPRVQAAMDQQQAIGEQQAAQRAGPIGAVVNTYANQGREVINQAARDWSGLATGKQSLDQMVLGPTGTPDRPGVMDRAAGMSDSDISGVQGVADASAKQYPVTSAATGVVGGLGLGLADPKNLAAMIVSGIPAGAAMESAPVQRALGAVEAKYGPRIAGAVETLLTHQVGGGSFGATAGAMDPNGTPATIAENTAAGAGLGTITGAAGAAIGGIRANKAARSAIDTRLNEPDPRRAIYEQQQAIAQDRANQEAWNARLSDQPPEPSPVQPGKTGAAQEPAGLNGAGVVNGEVLPQVPNSISVNVNGEPKTVTATTVREDDGWRVKHLKLTNGGGAYDQVLVPEGQLRGFATSEEARAAAFDGVRRRYEPALPADKSPQPPPEPAPQVNQQAEDVVGGAQAPKPTTLYSEQSPDRAVRMLDPKGGGLGVNDNIWLSNNPDLATGQGDNKGVRIEFDGGGLKTVASTSKPGADFQAAQGNQELMGAGRPEDYQRAARKVTISGDAIKTDPFARGLSGRLRKDGWTESRTPDGGHEFVRPQELPNVNPPAQQEATPEGQAVRLRPPAPDARPEQAVQRGVEGKGADATGAGEVKPDPISMKAAELRAELEAGGVEVGPKETRKSLVEGVRNLRAGTVEKPPAAMTAKEFYDAQPTMTRIEHRAAFLANTNATRRGLGLEPEKNNPKNRAFADREHARAVRDALQTGKIKDHPEYGLAKTPEAPAKPTAAPKATEWIDPAKAREAQPGEVLPNGFEPTKFGPSRENLVEHGPQSLNLTKKVGPEKLGADIARLKREGAKPAEHRTVPMETIDRNAPERGGVAKLKAFIREVPEFAIDPHLTVEGDGVNETPRLRFKDGGTYKFAPETIGVRIGPGVKDGERIAIDIDAVKKMKPGEILQVVRNEATASAKATPNPRDINQPGDKIRDAMKNEEGSQPLDRFARTAEALANLTHNLSETGQRFKNRIKGDVLPKLAASSQDTADAAVRHAAAKPAAPRMADAMIADVLGDGFKDTDLQAKVGAVLTQDNLDSIRDNAEDPSKVKTLIGAGGFFKTKADYDAALADPKVKAAIDAWKAKVNPWMDEQYRAQKGLGPEEDLPSRGKQTGARINLLPVLEDGDKMAQKPVSVGPAAPRLSSTLKQKSPFERRATGTAQTYDVNLHNIAENTVVRQWGNATKIKFYDALQKSGDGVVQKSGPAPKVKGEGTFGIDLKRQTIIKDGEAIPANQTLWVRNSLRHEVEGVLGLRRGIEAPIALKVGKALNAAQIVGVTDALTHTANIFRRLNNAPGGESVLRDIARKVPGLNVIDGVGRWISAGTDLLKDTPEVRERMAYLAENGMLRDGKGAMGAIDAAGRLALDRMYTNLVDRGLETDSVSGRRTFINKIGQYNGRLQGSLEATVKDVGISPFIVAGKTFNRAGIEALFGTPGVQGSSTKARIYLRSMQLLGVGMSGLVAPVAFNTLRGLPPFGRPGVPAGAIDLGTNDEKGKPKYLDTLEWIGARRGLRVLGANAGIQAARSGLGKSDLIDNVVNEAANTAIHPYAGPGAQFLTRAATGGDIALPPRRKADAAAPGHSQAAQNLKYAAKGINPMTEGGIDGYSSGGVNGAIGGALKAIPSAAGIKSGTPINPAAVHGADLKDYTDNLLSRARKGGKTPAERIAFVRKELDEKKIVGADRARIMKAAIGRLRYAD